MRFKLTTIAAAVLMTGCVSHQPTAICTEGERLSIQRRDQELAAQKKQLDRYLAGEPVPNQAVSWTGQMAQLGDLRRQYNRAFDALALRAAAFNRQCTGKPVP